MSCQDNNVRSVRKPEGYDGKRFINLHAGTCKQFVKRADIIFASKSENVDYHREMNSDSFSKWVKEKLIPNLAEPSLIIMDNAHYHSVFVEKHPSTSLKKLEIIDWLKKHKINYEENMTLSELILLAKINKKEDKYVPDEYLLREHGHEVLRLLLYHYEFNAIELIWAKAKSYNDHIGRDGYTDEKNCNEDFWNN